jgi:hypothetical protein
MPTKSPARPYSRNFFQIADAEALARLGLAKRHVGRACRGCPALAQELEYRFLELLR